MSLEDSEPNKERKNLTNKKVSFNGLVVGIIVAVAFATFFAGLYIAEQNSNQLTQKDLDDAIAKLELKMMQQRLPTAQPQLPAKISADNDPTIGNPDAPITIIEFSDFQCPFCARFHVQTLPSLMEEYIEQGKVKLVFRDFPIQNIHPNALPASVAAECANDQGKFKEMHDLLFENQKQWSNLETSSALSAFVQYASDLQLDEEEFTSCLTEGKHVSEIRKDLEDGRNYGVTGTPGFFIGNDAIGYVELKGAQPFESFKKVIDSQLAA